MILYVDISALVKLYVPEPESDAVQALVGNAQFTAVSLIAFAEARAAFTRKRRERAVSPKDYRRIMREFDDDWDHYFVVDITEPLVNAPLNWRTNMACEGTMLSNFPRRSCCANRAARR